MGVLELDSHYVGGSACLQCGGAENRSVTTMGGHNMVNNDLTTGKQNWNTSLDPEILSTELGKDN